MPIAAADSADKPRHGRIEHRTFQIVTVNDIGFLYALQAIRIVRQRLMVSTGERLFQLPRPAH